MAATGGGEGGQEPPPPPIFFTKVAVRYAPLVLPTPLHNLPENYIKNLPKFTGEGDLTTTKHINFFDQFADILGLEHEDVYSRLFVQNFEGKGTNLVSKPTHRVYPILRCLRRFLS